MFVKEFFIAQTSEESINNNSCTLLTNGAGKFLPMTERKPSDKTRAACHALVNPLEVSEMVC